jgi:hypothetical protein
MASLPGEISKLYFFEIGRSLSVNSDTLMELLMELWALREYFFLSVLASLPYVLFIYFVA